MSASFDIAIVGMAGRFPGARSVDDFWQNLAAGVESIATFTDDEVRAAGIGAGLLADPMYVKAGGLLDDIEWFDAAFFGYTPREAEVMDPQQRVFLECAWEALEAAGYDAERCVKPVGVYAGMSMNTYVLSNLIHNPAAVQAVGEMQAAISNLHDHLATRVSYKLDLRGPSLTVQTACSTSLVAVHLACQALLAGECDMALAGGVSVSVPQRAGYLYNEGGPHSRDGHCRAFDAGANGMIGGSGVGVVVLKRVDDAVADGDHIVAVVKGTAINNDGASKVGYTAPSVDGQARVIRAALRVADVAPETIGYIETHGTGTVLGDPIEIEALGRAFQSAAGRPGSCAIGSVKTNVGHLDAAAGIAGLIKTALALEHRHIPPSLFFERPNPRIDFGATPFFVVNRGQEWKRRGTPRRAGVSAFGIGGTNAHAVLEEAPQRPAPVSGDGPQICVVSARTGSALAAARGRLAAHIEAHPGIALADVGWTLQSGRRAFPFRAALVARSPAEAAALLRAERSPRLSTRTEEPPVRDTVLLFPGQGSQYIGMGRGLYARFPAFRDAVDRVAAAMAPMLDVDVRVLLGYDGPDEGAEDRLRQTEFAQPALFAVEYAVAQLLAAAGVKPAACLGHSIGEYVAACLAGVFTLEDAAAIVVIRGRLMALAPNGAMLAVLLSEDETLAWLDGTVSLAAINGPSACAVSGDVEAIGRLERRLTDAGVTCSRLRTSHGFHSAAMDDAAGRFAAAIAGRPMSPPRIPFISSLTGRWIEAEQAVDAHYWARQLRSPVRFFDGVITTAAVCSRLIEAGPGAALTTLARQSLGGRDVSVLTTLPRAGSADPGDDAFLAAVARLWTERVPIEWRALHEPSARRRVPLPTYPFERQRHWIEPLAGGPAGPGSQAHSGEPVLRLHVPSWIRDTGRPSDPEAFHAGARRWLVLCDSGGLGAAIARRLEGAGQMVASVPAHAVPCEMTSASWLNDALRAGGQPPDVIVHCLSASPIAEASIDHGRRRAFESLVAVARALEAQRIFSPIRLEVVSSNLHDVLGTELLDPLQAFLVGPLKVIPQEYQNVRTRNIDVLWPDGDDVGGLADSVVSELSIDSADQQVALRAGYRWTQHYLAGPVHRPTTAPASGAVIIFGGLGKIGLVAARAVAAASTHSRLVLAGRNADAGHPAVRDLERCGAEVLVLDGNVEDAGAVRRVFVRARERFGAVAGVIHAAGPSGSSALAAVADMDDAHLATQFGAKVRGLFALEQVVADVAPSFVLLTSSLSTVLGGLGFAAYASGNAVMDAFAAAKNRAGSTRWIAVDWDGWRFDVAAAPGAVDQTRGEAAFMTLLHTDLGARVLVVADDLEPRLARWINPGGRTELPSAQATAASARTRTTEVIQPGSDLERLILQIWHELLGVPDISVEDSFFEIGGHSLLATQLVSRLRRALLLDVPLRVAFDAPTVRGIAAGIIDHEPAPGQAEATARLRLRLAQMTPEQMKAMIAARQQRAEEPVER